ncbi:MAG TPA: 6-phosphogluconolactonase [Acidimicrobiales bacterium]|nr:6-phosphogluconolactonase [Acidimicrobiales bacterium]
MSSGRPPVGEVQVAEDVAGAFAALVGHEAPRTIALSGGGTARRCYERLAVTPGIEWPSVTVLFGDERWVPVTSDDSNEGMAREVLLNLVDPAEVRSLRGAGDIPEEAAAAYDTEVAALPGIDLVHLGLGDDGHTASLFPGSPALAVHDRLVVATGDDAHPHRRLTFTFPAIARAGLAVVTISGSAKAEAWRRLCQGDDVPAAHIRAERVLWLVDSDATG